MMAAKKGNVGIVRKLIKHGANMKLTNKVNESLFQIVCSRVCKDNSNGPRSCMSTKTMRSKSSHILELWLPPTFCITNFVNFSGFCSPMIVLVISSF